MAVLVWDWELRLEGETTEVRLEVQVDPRSKEALEVPIVYPGNLMSSFNPTEWGMPGDIDSEESHDHAVRWVLACVSIMVEWVAKEVGSRRVLERRQTKPTFDEQLRWLWLQPATDKQTWRYIAKRIYWSWCFGLPFTTFDYVDELVLGLPRDKTNDDLRIITGQIDRVAQAGTDHYWIRNADGQYVPTLKLIREWREGLPQLT